MKNKKLAIGIGMMFLLVFSVYASTLNDNSQADFDNGAYNRTFYNNSINAVQLNATFNNGTFTSQVFNASKNATWNNLSWWRGYGFELPNYKASESYIVNSANMTGNVLLMHMNEQSGTMVDYSGAGNNGTNNGAAYGASGKFNSALNFVSAQSDYVSVSDSSSLDITGNITVAVWVYANSVSAYSSPIMKTTENDMWEDGYGLFYESGAIKFYVDAWNTNVATSTALTTGVWHHIVGTYDGSNVRIYVNGVQGTPDAYTGSITTNNAPLYVGSGSTTGGAGYYWNGRVDEAAIWNRSLSSSEIQDIYQRGLLSLNLSVRSCDDVSCDTEQFTDLNDTSPQDLSANGIADNQYFQYKFEFETDNASYSPELYNISIDYTVDNSPYWSNNETSIVQTYSPTTQSYFNITWQDDNAVSTVWFESNYSGTSTNYSMNNITTIVYNYSTILPAGTHYWKSYANDSLDQWNQTNMWIFTIQKATPTCSLVFTPTSPQDYDTTINASCSCINPETTAILYRNGTDVTAENNQLVTLAAGDYLYNCTTPSTQNYTTTENTSTYTINKAVPGGSVSGTSPITYGAAGDVQGTETNGGDGDVVYTLYRDNISVSNPDTTVLGVGTYDYIYNATSGQNYTANSSIGTFSLIVNQAASSVNLTLNNSQSNITIAQGATIDLNCSTINGDSGAILQIYNNGTLINEGTSPIGNTTTLPNEIPPIADTTPPTVTLNSPIDYYNTSSQQIAFNCNVYDDIKVENVTLYGSWSGWSAKETNSSGINNTDYIFTKTIVDGTYLWSCYACDNSSNCAFATNNRSLTVDSTAPVITNVQNISITSNSAVITWNTDELSNSSVNYGNTTNLGTINSLDDSVTSHSISLSGLSQNTSYYYNVTSCDDLGNCNTSGTYNLTTTTIADNQTPTITNIQAGSITNQSALITWDTDEISNSSVNYGTDLSLGTVTGQNDAVTSHNVSLTNLVNNTLYYYNVTSCDPSGNCNVSGSYNFTTLQTTIDNSPNVSLISPINNYTSINGSVTFECNASDDNQIANTTLYHNISGIWQANYTTNTDTLSHTITGISDGSYIWNCLAYDNNSQSDWANTNRTINVILDTDDDGVPDENDTLEGTEDDVVTDGINNLNITVGGNSTNGTFNGEQEIIFYDGTDVLMNFTHNFSTSEIDLSKISIEITSLSIVVNLSGQLLTNEKKALFIDDNSFISLCVKDAEITTVSQISDGCNQANETDFTSCLGDNTGVSINNITCYDEGSTIRIENLTYSGIKGTQASTQPPSGGGGGGGYSCTSVWQCTGWSECYPNGTRTKTCTDIKNCRIPRNKPSEIESCIYTPSEEPIEKIKEELTEDITEEIEEEPSVEEKPVEIEEKELIVKKPSPIRKVITSSLLIILISLLFIITAGAVAYRYVETRTLRGVVGRIKTYSQKEKSLEGKISKDRKFVSGIKSKINRLKEEKERETRAIHLLRDVKKIDKSSINKIGDDINKTQTELKRTSTERDKIDNTLKLILDKENELISNKTKLIEQKEKLEHQKQSLFFKFEKYNIAVPDSMQKEILPKLNSIDKEIETISDNIQTIKKKRSKLIQKKKEYNLFAEKTEIMLKDKQKAYELANKELETTQKKIKGAGVKRTEEAQLLMGLAEQKKKKLQNVREEKAKLKEIKEKEHYLIEQASKLGKEEIAPKIRFVSKKGSSIVKESEKTKEIVLAKFKEVYGSAKTKKHESLPVSKKTKMSEKKKQMLKKLKDIYK